MQRISLLTLLNPLYPIFLIKKDFFFLKQMTVRNIQTRFKGTFGGILWLGVFPLIMLGIYSFVFREIIQSRWGAVLGKNDTTSMFALMLFCGMSVFNIFSDSVSAGVRAIADRPNFVKKIITPTEEIPLSSVMSATLISLLWFAILLFFAFFEFNCTLPWTVILLPVMLLPLILFSAGTSWVVSSLGVYIKDLAQVVPLLVQMLFFLSPVFYSMKTVPEKYRFILEINPMTVLIEQTRQILLLGEMPDWRTYLRVLVISWICFHAGFIWFMKTKRGFADVM